MGKSLSDRISERAKAKPSPSGSNANRAVLLAIRSDVEKALDDGWSILAAYQTLHEEGVVTFSYQAFRRYVNSLVLNHSKPEEMAASGLKESGFSSEKKANKPTEPVMVKPTAPASFTFNPVPNKEELF